MANGGKVIVKFLPIWKNSFSQGVVIPHIMRNCTNCKKDILSDKFDKLVNQKKEFSANLSEMKGQSPNEFGLMLLKYIT